jgi:hypothetical protein
MKRSNSSLLVLFCLFTVSWAQGQRTKMLSGEVDCPEPDCSGINVLNKRSLQGTITDDQGRFSIAVRLGDTLVFSAVQFKLKLLKVEEYLLKANFVRIPMDPFVNELEEVVVQPYNLSGSLGSDAVNFEPAAPPNAESLGLPNAGIRIISQEERKLYEATSGSGLVPLNPILNAITGRTKRLKKQLRIQQTYQRTQRVRAFYPDSLFVKELGVPKEKIPDFMYYCEIDSVFQSKVDTRDRLLIWEYMKNRAKTYVIIEEKQ